MKNLKRSHFIFKKPLSVEAVLDFDTQIDEYFGVYTSGIEKSIIDEREGSYQGIDPRALSTSYIDYYKILNMIPKGKELVDIGAGYCRGSLLAHELNLGKCISIEFVKSRADLAFQTLGSEWIKIQDLLTEKLYKAEYYYLYFPRGQVLDHVLRQIISYQAHVVVCESHGDVMEYLEVLGFIEKDRFEVSLPRHNPNIKFYRSPPLNKDMNWHDNLSMWMLLNQEKFFVVEYLDLIRNEKMEWFIAVKDAQWINYHDEPALELKNGRIVLISKNEKIIKIEQALDPATKLIDGKYLRELVH